MDKRYDLTFSISIEAANKGRCTVIRQDDVAVVVMTGNGVPFGGCSHHKVCGVPEDCHREDVAEMPNGCLVRMAFEALEEK